MVKDILVDMATLRRPGGRVLTLPLANTLRFRVDCTLFNRLFFSTKLGISKVT